MDDSTTVATKDASLRRSKRRRYAAAPEDAAPKAADSGREKSGESPSRSGDFSEEESDDFENDEPSRRKRKASSATEKCSEKSLIEIIKDNGKLIPKAVGQWVDRYDGTTQKAAIVELLTSLFEACGAKYQLNEASLDETSVDDVVLALVDLARNGEINDWFTSKSKDFKTFKENLVEFWDTLVIECQDGPLFDQILFEKCMDYIIALSCTPPRIFRLVGSLVGLQLVTSLITVAKTLASQRETTQRQLNTEKKRKTDGPRVESLNKRLSIAHEKITFTEEMMRKVFTGLFMHRYRDIDPDIRQMSIKALGVWIVSYPSLFLQDSYLKYLGWTLNDKSAAVRKTSVLALQNLYEVDDIVPSLGLFTERFCNRMIELADDIDISVAVSAIGLLKQLLRHQLLADDELGPLYDLLIDEPPAIRRAIGELVYDHLIAQKLVSSQSGSREEDDEASEIHLGRMLQILREFSTDPLLSAYVIDDVWDDMKAMRDWKCIISMLLDENPSIELTDVDATNLVRLLVASVKKAVGNKIVPAPDNRKPHLTKAQKESLENSRREITSALLKSYPQLLRKFMADKAKIPFLVELILYLKLDLYSLKRQGQNFRTVLESIKSVFFKHGEKETLRACVKAITLCCVESQADLRDFANKLLKELEIELTTKLKTAMKDVQVGDDDYSLLVNLKRLYEFQLQKSISFEGLYEDMANMLKNSNGIDYEVVAFLLLNMYLHVAWSLKTVDDESPSEGSITSLLDKRTTLFELLVRSLDSLLEGKEENNHCILASRVVIILAEMWCLFKKSRFQSTKLESLGYCAEASVVQKFWRLCELQLDISDDTEDEGGANEEYIEETNRDVIMVAAAKLVAANAISKDYLRAEIISHFIMHGTSVAEIVKHLISVLKKNANDEIPDMYVEALKKAYQRRGDTSSSVEDPLTSKFFVNCKDLAVRLSGMFIGAARNKHKSQIMKIVKDGILYAFENAPKQLAFLDCAVFPFVSKLPTPDILDTLKDVEERSETFNTDEDPSGWRPYYTFIERLREKYALNDVAQDEKEGFPAKRRRGRPRKQKVQGKKLFDEQGSSEEEDSISESDQEDHDGDQEGEQHEDGEEDEEEEERPLIHSLKSSSSKLRLMRVSKQDRKVSVGSQGSE